MAMYRRTTPLVLLVGPCPCPSGPADGQDQAARFSGTAPPGFALRSCGVIEKRCAAISGAAQAGEGMGAVRTGRPLLERPGGLARSKMLYRHSGERGSPAAGPWFTARVLTAPGTADAATAVPPPGVSNQELPVCQTGGDRLGLWRCTGGDCEPGEK